MLHPDLNRIRDSFVEGTMALVLGVIVYTLLALAWTFKTTVEAPNKLRHSLHLQTHSDR